MRMPRVRFTVRRMMVAVAAIAVLLAGGIKAARMSRLARTHQMYATQHGLSEAIERRNVNIFEYAKITNKKRPDICAIFDQLARVARLRVDYYAVLKVKYADAATHPWKDVPPDPPRP